MILSNLTLNILYLSACYASGWDTTVIISLYILISCILTYSYTGIAGIAKDKMIDSGEFNEKEIEYLKFVSVVTGVKIFLFWPIAFLFILGM